jgi:hypothetical protein
MPILTVNPLAIVQPETPYQRLAFRGSLSARLEAGEVTRAGLGLNITRYRKLDSGGLEYLGSPQGASAYSLELATDADAATLLRRIASTCAAALLPAPITADLVINFNWRDRAGDIVGLVHATVTPAGGEELVVASADVADWDQAHLAFALAYADALDALAVWVAAKGV